MGQFRDALDKQFPPKTDEQRAAYYAVRRHLEQRTPAWQFDGYRCRICGRRTVSGHCPYHGNEA